MYSNYVMQIFKASLHIVSTNAGIQEKNTQYICIILYIHTTNNKSNGNIPLEHLTPSPDEFVMTIWDLTDDFPDCLVLTKLNTVTSY